MEFPIFNLRLRSVTQIFVVLVGVFWSLVFPQSVFASGEVIKDFNAAVRILQDGRLLVEETIVYHFDTSDKHGIYRTIPLTSTQGPDLALQDFAVRDAQDASIPFVESISDHKTKVRIGNSHVTLKPGDYTYKISYKVLGAVREYADHDEVYWNVTGNDWPVTIEKSDAGFQFISDNPELKVQKTNCYSGSQGSKDSNCEVITMSEADGLYVVSSNSSLSAGEGLSAVFWLPKGMVQNAYRDIQNSLTGKSEQSPEGNSSNNLGFLVIVIFLVASLVGGPFVFAARSRKQKVLIPRELKGKPVVVEYSPPDNLSPLDVGTLMDRKTDPVDISAVILDLAVRGYLKITYTEQKLKFWPDKKDYLFSKLQDKKTLTHPIEERVYDLLFLNRDHISLSELGDEGVAFHSAVESIVATEESYLQTAGYLEKRDIKMGLSSLVGLAFFALVYIFKGVIFGLFALHLSYLPLVFVVCAGVFFAVISILVTLSKTSKLSQEKGVPAVGKILGFQEYLKAVESDKLKMLNAPELKPETFEKFLPYAMVLGAEEAWAKKFQGIYMQTPTWYTDTSGGAFNTVVFLGNMTAFSNSLNHTYTATAPRQTTSGFGSGGFSGGGSGGGGGGSW